MPALPVSAEGRFRVIRDVKILVEGKSEFFDDEGECFYCCGDLALTSLSQVDIPL
jgi:hypothetical protein